MLDVNVTVACAPDLPTDCSRRCPSVSDFRLSGDGLVETLGGVHIPAATGSEGLPQFDPNHILPQTKQPLLHRIQSCKSKTIKSKDLYQRGYLLGGGLLLFPVVGYFIIEPRQEQVLLVFRLDLDHYPCAFTPTSLWVRFFPVSCKGADIDKHAIEN